MTESNSEPVGVRYLCPACHKPLRHGINIDSGEVEHVMYCARETGCHSKAVAEGVRGATAEITFGKLTTAYQMEKQ